MNEPEAMLGQALDAVADACTIARRVQQDGHRVRRMTKDDRSPVTVADFAVQAIVALDLAAAGEALIVGEENAAALRGDEHATLRQAVAAAVQRRRPEAGEHEILDAIDACDHDASAGGYWTLDPIDGTKGFLRGQQYAIALARIENGRVVLGVMGCPNLSRDPADPLDEAHPLGTLHHASIGGGAWARSAGDPTGPAERIRAAGAPGTETTTIRVCESVESSHSSQGDTMRILDRLGADGEPVRLDSQCKYVVVARGQADAYLRLPTRADYREMIWDHAAGMLIAAEAGAVVTDITGAPLQFTHGSRLEANRGIVCARSEVHGRLVEAIAELGIAAAV